MDCRAAKSGDPRRAAGEELSANRFPETRPLQTPAQTLATPNKLKTSMKIIVIRGQQSQSKEMLQLTSTREESVSLAVLTDSPGQPGPILAAKQHESFGSVSDALGWAWQAGPRGVKPRWHLEPIFCLPRTSAHPWLTKRCGMLELFL